MHRICTRILVLGLLGCAAALPAAQVDYFLEIDGIEGESQDKDHEAELDVLSFTFALLKPIGGRGGLAVGGRTHHAPLVFTNQVDKASPQLMKALEDGRRFPTVTLSLRKAGADEDYLVYTFTDCQITGYSVSGSGGEVPTEQVTLNYAKVEATYTQQDEDGSTSEPGTPTYDISTNRR